MATKEEVRQRLVKLFGGKEQGQSQQLAGNHWQQTTVITGDGELGALRGETHVVIQTRQAQVLLAGRPASDTRPRVMGLMQFGHYLAQITQAVKQDDPWADWYLLKVEEALIEAEANLQEQLANLVRVLGANPMMDIKVSQSVKPLKVSVGFASSYAYWIARVITQYDEVVRAVLTARHHALLDNSMANLLLADAAKLVRRVFESTARYRVTGLTRADVVAGATVKVAEAEKQMGKLPDDILDGSRRGRFAPAVMNSSRQNAGAVAANNQTTEAVVTKVEEAEAAD